MLHEKVVCIYHKDCSDGTASAAVVLKRFPEAKLYPVGHGYTKEEADVVLAAITPDTVVYTVDCVLLVRECVEKGNTVISLDHHVSECEDMTTFAQAHSNYTYVFDNALSGAGLAWTYFFPSKSMPRWIELVQDKDLWTKKYVESDYFMNWSWMQINKPHAFLFLFDDPKNTEECLQKGRSVEDLNQFYIQAFKEKTKPLFVLYKDCKIPAYNATYLQSVLGNILADEVLGVCIIFSIKGKSVRMSIRSLHDSKVSALEIAQSFGGGGHRNSAGCETSITDFFSKIA